MPNRASIWLSGLAIGSSLLLVCTTTGAGASPKSASSTDKNEGAAQAKPSPPSTSAAKISTKTTPESATAHSSIDETIVLTQKCKAVGNTYTVHASKDHLLMESHALSIASDAPKWDIVVLNLKTKVYFQSDYKRCLRLIAATRPPYGTIGDLRALKWHKAANEPIAGFSANQWLSGINEKSHNTSVKYWTLQKDDFAPQCAEIIATAYAVPLIPHGIPLRFVYKGTGNSLLIMPTRQYDVDGARAQETRLMDTISVKNIPTAMTHFAVPKGFKQVQEYKDAALDNTTNSKADMQFIIKDLSRNPDALFNSR